MQTPQPTPSRRTFLAQTAAAVAATTAAISTRAHAAGSDTIKVGLVGCGGRGTGAAEQALTADPGTRLVAVGDAFPEAIESSLGTLKMSPVGERVDVASDHRFTGFDAYKQVIDAVDVVLLATPPGFRPIHFAHAVAQGKHTFVEKPMAVDGPGLRAFLAAARTSKDKGLSAVNGFCWRYFEPRRELMKRVADGAIGSITSIETTYNSRGVWDPRKTREECANEMEYQMRNWYYYSWLSGDHIVEQAVHGIDTMAWAMGDAPAIKCWGMGGRQVRTDAKYGNIWDHFSVVYEYPNDVKGYHHCRHWPATATQVADFIQGTNGRAEVFARRITGPNKWRYEASDKQPLDMYQSEHNEMFAAIRSGRPINNAEQGATSTLLALMGRMAAYTGEVITWDKAMNSQETLVPTQFAWGDAPHPVNPIPGVTRFT